jgi:hypothetical protein
LFADEPKCTARICSLLTYTTTRVHLSAKDIRKSDIWKSDIRARDIWERDICDRYTRQRDVEETVTTCRFAQ